VDASKEAARETPTPTPIPGPAPRQDAPQTTTLQGENLAELTALVNQTYQGLAGRDFYSVLGIDGRGSMDEMKTAYYRLARKFHPDRFYGVHDPVLKEKVDVIFSAVNVAYETLKSAKRRQEYDNAPKERRLIPPTKLNSETTATKLTREAITKVAEEHYQKAQRAYEEGNYYQAVQFLRSATQIEPNVGKYWQQLGISLSRNPQWRKEAEDSFQRAMDLEPRNPENHLYLGFLYKNAGMKLRAVKHFKSCRDMDPYNEIANRELAMLESGEAAPAADQSSAAKKGLLGNIFKKK
jgi:curved DNA-binding protein CbpA